jgi:hypothetical protein
VPRTSASVPPKGATTGSDRSTMAARRNLPQGGSARLPRRFRWLFAEARYVKRVSEDLAKDCDQ